MFLYYRIFCCGCKCFLGHSLFVHRRRVLCAYCKNVMRYELQKKGLELWEDA